MDGMESSMFEMVVGVPRQLWNRLESAAHDDSVTVSAMVAEALNQHLSCRARIRSVEAWAWSGTAADYDELAQIDPAFEATGCA